ncbi:hypothetical protein MBLNU459_g3552t1 [Dothideomycetes sp. NU459]
MTDLLQVLPDLDTTPYSHLLPSLEKALVTTSDLLSLDALDVARRAQVPAVEVRRLADALVHDLHAHVGISDDHDDDDDHGTAAATTTTTTTTIKSQAEREERRDSQAEPAAQWSAVSTLDDALDAALGGGFPAGVVTELAGESAAGKTQLLLSLLLAVQLPPPRGLGRAALYLSTEAPLQTKRLAQILARHPYLSSLPPSERPSLARIQSAQTHDLEAQEHMLRFQVPVQARRSNVGLVIVDSVAANFRAEFDQSRGRNGIEALAQRSTQLVQLGALLRHLARSQHVAVVVANQVLDRFTAAASVFDHVSHLSQRSLRAPPDDAPPASGRSALSRPPSTPHAPPSASSQPPPPALLSSNDPLALDHQQRFFTGWGDDVHVRDLKTPSLGLTWTNQVAARVVLLKEPIYKTQDYLLGPGADIVGWRRYLKVAFASWCQNNNGHAGTAFEIWEGGIRKKGDSNAVEAETVKRNQ